MKKLVKIVSIVAMLALVVAMLTGCKVNATSSNVDSVTRNGITRTETTVTENGKTTHTVTYTDENGKELSAEVGEPAFNGTAAETGATAATGVTADKEDTAEPETVTATLVFDNQSGHDISGLYIVTENHEDWGSNLLEGDGDLRNEYKRTWENAVTYTADRTWKMAVKFADAPDDKMTGFLDLHFDAVGDPQMLHFILTPNADNTGYTLSRV